MLHIQRHFRCNLFDNLNLTLSILPIHKLKDPEAAQRTKGLYDINPSFLVFISLSTFSRGFPTRISPGFKDFQFRFFEISLQVLSNYLFEVNIGVSGIKRKPTET